jgi:hypothetical protein
MKNWKAAGPDQVHAFWLKELDSLHVRIAEQLQSVLDTEIPEWLGKGRTVLIIKDKEKGPVVENYRPITCLPTMWKLLTSIVSEEMYHHLEEQKLLPIEQKGCRKKSRGTKDQLLIDKLIMQHCKRKQIGLHVTWIDYKKAYDSVPHTWLLKSLELLKLNARTIKFLKNAMNVWSTQLTINNQVLGQCRIRRGIFQGDSLSPLLFVAAMIPLSNLLNAENKGFQFGKDGNKINHLLYMDDLKMYGKNAKEMKCLTDKVLEVSSDIGMEFGIAKCSTMVLKRGHIVDGADMTLANGQVIKGLQAEDSYKYLGMLESDTIKQKQMKEKIKQEYYSRVRKVLRSELNAGNVFQAMNVWAVSAFRYSSEILDWTKSELREIDSKTRKLLTMNKAHHPRASVARLYLPRELGGRGLLNIEQSVEEDRKAIAEYLSGSDEELLRKVLLEGIIKVSDGADDVKKQRKDERLAEWKTMPLAGQYIRDIEKVSNVHNSMQWLKKGYLKKETEGFIVAAQDQALRTNAFKVKIEKQGGSPMCRLCGIKEETVDHLVSSCSKIAQTDYKGRHDKVAANLHWSLCKQFGFERAQKWYEHRAERVLENDEYKLLWDMDIKTDKVIKERRPDIVIVKKGSREAFLIDVAVPGDSRVANKEVEKITKYQDLAVELQRLWELRRVKVIPVVIGALGAIPSSLPTYLKAMDIGDVSIEQLQKSVILSTARILRRYLKI